MKKPERLKAVVFCKECTAVKKITTSSGKLYYNWCRRTDTPVEDHHFCSYGERKENEQVYRCG